MPGMHAESVGAPEWSLQSFEGGFASAEAETGGEEVMKTELQSFALDAANGFSPRDRTVGTMQVFEAPAEYGARLFALLDGGGVGAEAEVTVWMYMRGPTSWWLPVGRQTICRRQVVTELPAVPCGAICTVQVRLGGVSDALYVWFA